MSAPFRQPLNPLQIELLELYARGVSIQDLLSTKQMLSDYFAQRAIEEADRLWDERGYTQETMQQWLLTHTRKSSTHADRH